MANFIPKHSPTDSRTRSLYKYDEDGSVRVRTDEVKKTIVDQASGSIFYEGRSKDINAETSDPTWQIKKIEEIGGEKFVTFLNEGAYNNVWDNRGTLFGDDASLKSYREPTQASTDFKEAVTIQAESFIDIQSTWGISDLRDIVTINGTVQRAANLSTGDVELSGGEIVLKSSATANIQKSIETIERHQYLPGSESGVGIGLRITGQPTGTDEGRWGYFDSENGFGFGIDSTDLFVFRLKGGVEQGKIHREDFNIDKLDGNGPSGATLNKSDGIVYKILFNLYGYGNIRFYLFHKDKSGFKRLILAHIFNPEEEIVIEDPNQPLTLKVKSEAAPGGTLNIAMSDRQTKIFRKGERFRVSRNLVEEIFRVEIPRNLTPPETWVPVMSFRKKPTFKGNPNSVRSVFKDFSYTTDQPIEIKVATRTVTSGVTWQELTDVSSGESSIEVRKQNANRDLVASNEGERLSFDYSTTGNQKVAQATRRAFRVIPVEGEITVFARLRDPSVNNNANLTLWSNIEERW